MGDDQKQPDPNALLVIRTFKEDGTFDVNLGFSGDVRPTEVGDLLEYARKLHRAKLGLD